MHVYDPVTDGWSDAAPLKQPRSDAVARLLRDGRILIIGGNVLEPDAPGVELYAPPTGGASTGATSPFVDPEQCHHAG